MRNTRRFLTLCLLIIASGTASFANEECKATGNINYICGPKNVEDLLHIKGTDWILAGQVIKGRKDTGGFYLINTATGVFSEYAPNLSGPIDPKYTQKHAQCPGAPDAEMLMSHGMSIKYGTGNIHEVYVLNHAERESAEIFDLDISGAKPTLNWKGCVLMPEGVASNNITYMPDGGFTVTSFGRANDKERFPKITSGQPTGGLFRWSPDSGWTEIPDGNTSGTNGIMLSPDGETLFVSSWGTSMLHIVKPDGDIQKIDLNGLHADNLSEGPDGSILITGQIGDGQTILECPLAGKELCTAPFRIIKFDPVTYEQEVLFSSNGNEYFGSASVAVAAGDEIWIGTFRGNRVAHIKIGS